MRSPPAVGWSDMIQANPKNEHWFRRDPQKNRHLDQHMAECG